MNSPASQRRPLKSRGPNRSDMDNEVTQDAGLKSSRASNTHEIPRTIQLTIINTPHSKIQIRKMVRETSAHRGSGTSGWLMLLIVADRDRCCVRDAHVGDNAPSFSTLGHSAQ